MSSTSIFYLCGWCFNPKQHAFFVKQWLDSGWWVWRLRSTGLEPAPFWLQARCSNLPSYKTLPVPTVCPRFEVQTPLDRISCPWEWGQDPTEGKTEWISLTSKHVVLLDKTTSLSSEEEPSHEKEWVGFCPLKLVLVWLMEAYDKFIQRKREFHSMYYKKEGI